MPPDYVTRFAPSPTGPLHLGHAYSALTGWDRAQAAGGRFLLRIEDIDVARCRPEFEMGIYDVLSWLGMSWEHPVLRQSANDAAYRTALSKLIDLGVCYPCQCSRGDIRAALSAPQEKNVHQAQQETIYPGTCRGRRMEDAAQGDAIRLDISLAAVMLGDLSKLWFTETNPHSAPVRLDADRLKTLTGDIVLARRKSGDVAYHLAVVVDDAAQHVTEVVRGDDLAEATHVQRLLQALLQLTPPSYFHHRLIRDSDGKRLAKRDDAMALAKYRDAGTTVTEIRAMLKI